MKTLEIAGIPIGPGHPPVFWPDIDLYFKGDEAQAETLVHRLKDAGVRFVKGALIQRPDLCLNNGAKVSYFNPDRGVVQERYRDVIDRHVFDLEKTRRLYSKVQQLGMNFVLSVYDIAGADFAKDIGTSALKISSSNIVHEPLIRYVAELNLPVVIDTGKSTLEEIARAIQWARDSGAEQLIVQHSPAGPPAGLDQHHLRMLRTFAETFDCLVGLSDHHAGEEMLYAAVALDAHVLEKGVCSDDAEYDIDIAHALPIGRVKDVWEKCSRIWQALGSPMRQLQRDRAKPPDRMGLIARQPLKPGDVVSLDNVDFAMPAAGIPVEHWSQVHGWRLTKPLDKGSVIEWSHVAQSAH